jgi:uncharacterized protein DUF2537
VTMVEGAAVELRAVGERAVLVGHDGAAEREVDPHKLALSGELSDALHEWAQVAAAVRRTRPESGAAGAVVSRRGRQLALRVAESMGVPVGYVDPLTGEELVIDPPEPGPRHRARRPAAAAPSREPTPWLTGLALSAFTTMLVLFAVVSLATGLSKIEGRSWLAVGAQLVVTAGLLPSVLLARRVPIWRWVAFGVAAGLALGWVVLPFIML